jgi:hypothetical protein
MNNRDLVINLVSKLPAETSLGEIARQIRFIDGIQTARAQAKVFDGLPAEAARKLVDVWAARPASSGRF